MSDISGSNWNRHPSSPISVLDLINSPLSNLRPFPKEWQPSQLWTDVFRFGCQWNYFGLIGRQYFWKSIRFLRPIDPHDCVVKGPDHQGVAELCYHLPQEALRGISDSLWSKVDFSFSLVSWLGSLHQCQIIVDNSDKRCSYNIFLDRYVVYESMVVFSMKLLSHIYFFLSSPC